MGTYTELTVAGYPLLTSKSAVIPEVMTMFRESDRHVFVRHLSERNPLVWGSYDGADETEPVIEYSCETRCVIDRLNIMGFTLARVREEFEEGRQYELKECESDTEDGSQWPAERLEIMTKLSFDALATLKMPLGSFSLRDHPMERFRKQRSRSFIRISLSPNVQMRPLRNV
jgi:HEPN superfamily Toprim-like protein